MSSARFILLEDVAPALAPADPDDDSAEDTQRVLRFFGYAEKEVSAGAWGNLYDMAVVLLTAHKLDLRERARRARAGNGVNIGPLTSKKTGDLSESYAAPGGSSSSMNEQLLTSTIYGAEYLRLRAQLVAGPLLC